MKDRVYKNNTPITVTQAMLRELIWKAAQFDALQIEQADPAEKAIRTARVLAKNAYQKHELRCLYRLIENSMSAAKSRGSEFQAGPPLTPHSGVVPGSVVMDGFGKLLTVESIGPLGFRAKDGEYCRDHWWTNTKSWSVVSEAVPE